MATSSVRVSEGLVQTATVKGEIEHRSAAKQIEFWAEIGRNVERLTGLSAMDLMEISSGAKTLTLTDKTVAPVSTSSVLEAVAADRLSGELKKEVMQNGPSYQRCVSDPRYIEQVRPSGEIRKGNFINGEFQEA